MSETPEEIIPDEEIVPDETVPEPLPIFPDEEPSLPEETPDTDDGFEPSVEDTWNIEITVLARNRNDITQSSSIVAENRVTINNIVTDSQLLAILNFIEPKPQI